MSTARQTSVAQWPKLGLGDTPFALPPSAGKSGIFVGERRLDGPGGDWSRPVPSVDASVIRFQLRDHPRHQYREAGGRPVVTDLRSGQTLLHDLRRDPRVMLDQPYHAVQFHMPRSTFDRIADAHDAPRIGDLAYPPGAGIADTIVQNLALSVLAALRGGISSSLFIDQVSLALAAHVAQTYGGMRPMGRFVRGGLAPWQARRAKDLLAANLATDIGLDEVARECGLSISHFARAFRASVETTPHQWLMKQRLVAAKDLLRARTTQLAEIARACGFTDQSHFTRLFSREFGVTPGAWQRGLER